jgi:lipoic acid synthetase
LTRYPSWLLKKTAKLKEILKLRDLIVDTRIFTVCEEAKCPNIGECFSRKTLTFLILGNICTRNCAFCGVSKGKPEDVNTFETEDIKKVVELLSLGYVVVTSVTRDDLKDGGASKFADVVTMLHPIPVEVLVPDFKGCVESVKKVIEARPAVFNHNIETISRLYSIIRPDAGFQTSLEVLRLAKALSNERVVTKSGFMVGLGEKKEEVFDLFKDLKKAGCDIVTIGQYIPPSKRNFKVKKFVEPSEFKEYERFGEKLGLEVVSGPFVRSSYKAKETWMKLKGY